MSLWQNYIIQSTGEIKYYMPISTCLIRRDIFIPLDWTTFTLWAVREGVRDSERKIFGLLSPNWKLKSRGGGGFPFPARSLCHIITFRNGGCSTWGRVRRRWSGRRWRNVNLLNEFLHARCSPIIGICRRVLAEVTSKHPVPSVVPVRIVLGDCWRARGLKRIASHEKHNNLHHRCDLREIPRGTN